MVKKNFLMTAPLLMASFCSAQEKPNVVLIMVDDMGYSDIGCYGGEILTPNIDALASKGVRFTQFYNTSRSCPARASLMTGLYQHQAGIGQMSEDPFKNPGQKSPNDWGVPGYKGFLNRNCVTIAEVLKEGGYHTYMAGKWHLGMHGEEKWPLQRGFERFYGILAGACSYLRPSGGRGLTLDNTKLPEPEAPYYTTDAFTDYAIRFVDEQKDDKPFFLYLAFNAPHWPLQAKEEDIQKFTKIYREKGWDEIREARRKRMTKLGIIDPNTEFAEWENRKWDELTEKEKDEVAYRMAVYAAQVHCVDYNVGKLLDYLKKNRKLDNTLVMFLSDNGACAEPYAELGGGKVSEINNPACSVFPSYGRAWAQVSNTPFRKYKCRSYEGGISTPLIVSWKSNLKNKKGEWEVLRLYTFQSFKDGIYRRDAVLETDSTVKYQLADIPLPNGILRVDKVSVSEPTEICLGHYSLPRLNTNIQETSRKVDRQEVPVLSNGEYELAMIPLAGWNKVYTMYPEGLHPVSNQCGLIMTSDKLTDSKIYVMLQLWKKNDGKNTFSKKELSPVKSIRISEDKKQVIIQLSAKETKTILFQ